MDWLRLDCPSAVDALLTADGLAFYQHPSQGVLVEPSDFAMAQEIYSDYAASHPTLSQPPVVQAAPDTPAAAPVAGEVSTEFYYRIPRSTREAWTATIRQQVHAWRERTPVHIIARPDGSFDLNQPRPGTIKVVLYGAPEAVEQSLFGPTALLRSCGKTLRPIRAQRRFVNPSAHHGEVAVRDSSPAPLVQVDDRVIYFLFRVFPSHSERTLSFGAALLWAALGTIDTTTLGMAVPTNAVSDPIPVQA